MSLHLDSQIPSFKQTLPVGTVITSFALLTVLALASSFISSAFFSVFAMLYFVAFSGVIAKYSPAAFILLLWFIFIRLTTMVSGVAIESGGYMPEMVMSGYANGAFVRLAIFYAFGLAGAVWLTNALLPKVQALAVKPNSPTEKWAIFVFALVVALCAWAFLIGLKNGFPLLTNTDRIIYWKQVSSRFLFFFLGNRPILAALLGLVFATTTGRYRTASLGLIVGILGLSFLFAEKFTSICQILIFFITPVFLLNTELLRNTARRMVPLGALLAALTMPIVLVVYGVFEDPASAIDRLQVRATAQAEVWFVADQDSSSLLGQPQLMKHNIKALLSMNADEMSRTAPYLGARDFMSEYLETPRYNSYVERGVTLTMATEGYLLKAFGWLLGIPAYLVLIAAYTLQTLYFAYAIYSHSPVRIIIATKLLVWSNYGLNQGYFWNVIGIQIIALMVIILMAESMLHNHRRNNIPVSTVVKKGR